MSSSATSIPRPPARHSARLLKSIALGVLWVFAAAFVAKYVFHYYLNYNAAGFQEYWAGLRRGWLLLHITGGMTAILIGPWQFSNRLRSRHLKLHRVMGSTYLIAIALGAIGAFSLAVTTTFGWGWGFSLATLAAAWVTTSGMAFYAIRRRQIPVHKEWMVRSYIVTFAFVVFRVFNDYGPTSRLQPVGERVITIVWASWVIPLLAAEVIMQLRRMRTASPVTR